MERPTRLTNSPDADGGMVPASEVQAEAERLDVSPRLRRLSAEGLLAAPQGVGRGRGRGRRYMYPGRVFAQLGAVADARPHGHRYAALRHHVWWSPGGRLESWEHWRRDRLRELAPQVMAWNMPRVVSGDLPDEREQHLIEVAEGLHESRLPGMPRKALHCPADVEAFVRLFTSALLGDDMLDHSPESPEAMFALVQEVAAQPVDTDEVQAVGETFGALFERGIAWSYPSPPGVATGVRALACASLVPPPHITALIMATMTENRAAVLRDAVIGWARRRGTAALLRQQGLFAVAALTTWEVLAAIDDRALEVPVAAA